MIASNSRPLLRFAAALLLFYGGWTALYELWLQPAGNLDAFVVRNALAVSASLLRLAGFDAFLYNDIVGLYGSHGVRVGEACNAVPLFALFAGFLIAFPGPVRHKVWYIAAGVVVIHGLNILRIAVLCIMKARTPELLDFNHDYTFTLVVYGVVFGMWVGWVRVFGVGSGSRQWQ